VAWVSLLLPHPCFATAAVGAWVSLLLPHPCFATAAVGAWVSLLLPHPCFATAAVGAWVSLLLPHLASLQHWEWLKTFFVAVASKLFRLLHFGTQCEHPLRVAVTCQLYASNMTLAIVVCCASFLSLKTGIV
jgi:hypothetical protein